MLSDRGEIKVRYHDARSHGPARKEAGLQYADIIAALIGVFALGWAADQMTGRRGLFGTLLVSSVGAVCGWFLVIRVFGSATMDGWVWTVWSGLGSVVALGLFFLFRNTR